jgi:hypothetical protein
MALHSPAGSDRVTRVVVRGIRIAEWQVRNIRQACARFNAAELVFEAAPK